MRKHKHKWNTRRGINTAVATACMLTMLSACGDKKGHGDNFKGHINSRETYPESTEIEETEEEDEEEVSEVSKLNLGIVLETTDTQAITSETTIVTTITEATTVSEEAETGMNMSDISLVQVEGVNDKYLDITSYEIARSGDSYIITLETKDMGFGYEVIGTSINTVATGFDAKADGNTITIEFILEDGAEYGDVYHNFGVSLRVSGADETEIENEINFVAQLG